MVMEVRVTIYELRIGVEAAEVLDGFLDVVLEAFECFFSFFFGLFIFYLLVACFGLIEEFLHQMLTEGDRGVV